MLFVFRHGQSLFNVEKDREDGVILNDRNTVLTKRGVHHTLTVAEELKNTGIKPYKIITSTLARARQTGYLLASTLENGCILEEREELDEIRWTIPNGPYIRVEDTLERSIDDVLKDIYCSPVEGMENQYDVYKRVTPILPEIIIEALDKPIYLVSHYCTIRAIRAYMEHDKPEKMVNYDPPNVDPVTYTSMALEEVVKRKKWKKN
jgi:broad specificity phosphatase PhoE